MTLLEPHTPIHIPTPRWRVIIIEVCAEYGIEPRMILRKYGSRRYVPVRVEIARRMRAMGYSLSHIGRLLHRDHTTIGWYCGSFPSKRAIIHEPGGVISPAPLAPQQQIIFNVLSDTHWMTNREIEKATGIQFKFAGAQCRRLMRRGFVIRGGRGDMAIWRRK